MYKAIFSLLKMLNGKQNFQITCNMENFANFLFLLKQDTRKHIRTIENTENKFIKCQLTILFNNMCLNENIYTYKLRTFFMCNLYNF